MKRKHSKFSNWLDKLASLAIAILLTVQICLPPANVFAQSIPDLPKPGTLVLPTQTFSPAIIQGLTIHPKDPFKFDFMIDPGDQLLSQSELNIQAKRLIKYFLAALTVPETQMWVNLSPYEKNRIIPEQFRQTQMGRDLLAQDYILKQLSASMMYPEKELGQNFWKRVRARAQDEFNTTDIPLNTFNKIWIVPEKGEIYVHDQHVFVASSRLKVMLEEDYMALERHQGIADHLGESDIQSGISAPIVREILIPEIEREVNEGELFANLRQIYHSMILATWYKQNLKSSLLSKVYTDQSKLNGLRNNDTQAHQKIYQQYIEAFKKGVYNYIREDIDDITQEAVPRQYFAGGVALDQAQVSETTHRPELSLSKLIRFETRIDPLQNLDYVDQAMTAQLQDIYANDIFPALEARLFGTTQYKNPLLLISGLSGSGKSSLTNGLTEYFEAKERGLVTIKSSWFFKTDTGLDYVQKVILPQLAVAGASQVDQNTINRFVANVFDIDGARELLGQLTEHLDEEIDTSVINYQANGVQRSITINPGDIIVFEGDFSKELFGRLPINTSVFLDRSPQLAQESIIDRELHRGVSWSDAANTAAMIASDTIDALLKTSIGFYDFVLNVNRRSAPELLETDQWLEQQRNQGTSTSNESVTNTDSAMKGVDVSMENDRTYVRWSIQYPNFDIHSALDFVNQLDVLTEAELSRELAEPHTIAQYALIQDLIRRLDLDDALSFAIENELVILNGPLRYRLTADGIDVLDEANRVIHQHNDSGMRSYLAIRVHSLLSFVSKQLAMNGEVSNPKMVEQQLRTKPVTYEISFTDNKFYVQFAPDKIAAFDRTTEVIDLQGFDLNISGVGLGDTNDVAVQQAALTLRNAWALYKAAEGDINALGGLPTLGEIYSQGRRDQAMSSEDSEVEAQRLEEHHQKAVVEIQKFREQMEILLRGFPRKLTIENYRLFIRPTANVAFTTLLDYLAGYNPGSRKQILREHMYGEVWEAYGQGLNPAKVLESIPRSIAYGRRLAINETLLFLELISGSSIFEIFRGIESIDHMDEQQRIDALARWSEALHENDISKLEIHPLISYLTDRDDLDQLLTDVEDFYTAYQEFVQWDLAKRFPNENSIMLFRGTANWKSDEYSYFTDTPYYDLVGGGQDNYVVMWRVPFQRIKDTWWLTHLPSDQIVHQRFEEEFIISPDTGTDPVVEIASESEAAEYVRRNFPREEQQRLFSDLEEFKDKYGEQFGWRELLVDQGLVRGIYSNDEFDELSPILSEHQNTHLKRVEDYGFDEAMVSKAPIPVINPNTGQFVVTERVQAFRRWVQSKNIKILAGSKNQLAKQHGISVESVSRVLKELGVRTKYQANRAIIQFTPSADNNYQTQINIGQQSIPVYFNLEQRHVFDFTDDNRLNAIYYRGVKNRPLDFKWIYADDGTISGLLVGGMDNEGVSLGSKNKHLANTLNTHRINGWIHDEIVRGHKPNFGYISSGQKSGKSIRIQVTSADRIGQPVRIRYTDGWPVLVEYADGSQSVIRSARNRHGRVIQSSAQLQFEDSGDVLAIENIDLSNERVNFQSFGAERNQNLPQGEGMASIAFDQSVILQIQQFPHARFNVFGAPLINEHEAITALRLREPAPNTLPAFNYAVFRDLRTFKPRSSTVSRISTQLHEFNGIITGKNLDKEGRIMLNRQTVSLERRNAYQPVDIIWLSDTDLRVFLVDVLTDNQQSIRMFDINSGERITDGQRSEKIKKYLKQQGLDWYTQINTKKQRVELRRQLTERQPGIQLFSSKLSDLQAARSMWLPEVNQLEELMQASGNLGLSSYSMSTLLGISPAAMYRTFSGHPTLVTTAPNQYFPRWHMALRIFQKKINDYKATHPLSEKGPMGIPRQVYHDFVPQTAYEADVLMGQNDPGYMENTIPMAKQTLLNVINNPESKPVDMVIADTDTTIRVIARNLTATPGSSAPWIAIQHISSDGYVFAYATLFQLDDKLILRHSTESRNSIKLSQNSSRLYASLIDTLIQNSDTQQSRKIYISKDRLYKFTAPYLYEEYLNKYRPLEAFTRTIESIQQMFPEQEININSVAMLLSRLGFPIRYIAAEYTTMTTWQSHGIDVFAEIDEYHLIQSLSMTEAVQQLAYKINQQEIKIRGSVRTPMWIEYILKKILIGFGHLDHVAMQETLFSEMTNDEGYIDETSMGTELHPALAEDTSLAFNIEDLKHELSARDFKFAILLADGTHEGLEAAQLFDLSAEQLEGIKNRIAAAIHKVSMDNYIREIDDLMNSETKPPRPNYSITDTAEEGDVDYAMFETEVSARVLAKVIDRIKDGYVSLRERKDLVELTQDEIDLLQQIDPMFTLANHEGNQIQLLLLRLFRGIVEDSIQSEQLRSGEIAVDSARFIYIGLSAEDRTFLGQIFQGEYPIELRLVQKILGLELQVLTDLLRYADMYDEEDKRLLEKAETNVRQDLQMITGKLTDSAMQSESLSVDSQANKGGIDLDAIHLDLNITGDSIQLSTPQYLHNIPPDSISGFIPIIIHVTPVINIPGLLGEIKISPDQPANSPDQLASH